MMFEKISKDLTENLSLQLNRKLNADYGSIENQNLELIPISSMEEVAMRFRNSDENTRYEYFLVEVKTPLNQPAQVTPPPFKKVEAIAVAVIETRSQPAAATVAQTEKDDIPYLADNADLLLGVGEIELARNIYRAILKTGEASDVAYAGLAACADKEGLVEQAIQFAWDSVAFAPNKRGYQILAQLLVQQGRDQEASQALGRALKSLELSIQEKGDYYKMIGNCMSRLGQSTDAERAYKKALELSPASDEVQSNLGSLYLEQGQVSDAKRCYQDAIASNPANDKAWVGLGLCCVAEGDKESAHEAFARSLEKNLRNSTAVFHLVKCAYEIKKYSTAEKMLAHYVEIAPVSASLLYSLAGLQFHVGKKREATQTAKRILQLKSDHQGARDLLKRIDTENASA
jgi:tetratricopeptide (TPR) repeat protein